MKRFLFVLVVIIAAGATARAQIVSGSAGGAIGNASDSAYTGSGSASLVSINKGLYNQLGAVMPGNALGSGSSGLNATMGVGSASGDPCSFLTRTFKPINISTATTTNIITGGSSKKTYICHAFLFTAAANNVALVEGTTGGTCGSGTAGIMGGTTASSGLNLTANQGFVLGTGVASVAATATNNNDVCIITSAATQLSGVISYVQQ